MKLGKVPNEVLKELILNKLQINRQETLLGPAIGEDCSAIDVGENICVLTSDPITGSTKDIGKLAVHVNCNDIASSGAEPIGLMVTVLAPEDSTEEDIAQIMQQINEAAALMNIDILGGHTEVSSAVNRFVVMSTAIGKVKKEKLIMTRGAKVDEDIVLTKWAGLEGTAIIASEKEAELVNIFGSQLINEAKTYFDYLSVVPEGRVSSEFGVTSMHDVTEGGILGALWELSEACDLGVEIYYEKIPLKETTIKICEYFNINPLSLISSGCMLITCKNGSQLVELLGKSGIASSLIGRTNSSRERVLICEGKRAFIEPPKSDELYKVIN